MSNRITLLGKIGFEPEDKTKKHKDQATWKKMAMVFIGGEICEYYCWFINKRYNLQLNKPLRGGHISFINDSMKDLSLNGVKSMKEVNETWDKVKSKWDKQNIPITLDLNPRTDDRAWWLNVDPLERDLLHSIRAELGLGRPYWGLHMSIGYANEKNLYHSQYIHRLIKNGYIKFD